MTRGTIFSPTSERSFRLSVVEQDPLLPIEIEKIESLDDPRVTAYRDVKDFVHRERGRFLVEGRLNLRRLIEASPFRVASALVTPSVYAAMPEVFANFPDGAPVLLASPQLLRQIVGFNLHRGCLALADRRDLLEVSVLAERDAALVVALL